VRPIHHDSSNTLQEGWWMSKPTNVERSNACAVMTVDAPSPHPTSATLAPARSSSTTPSFMSPPLPQVPMDLRAEACWQARVEGIRAEHGFHHRILGAVAGTDVRQPVLAQGWNKPRMVAE
jgi:hypothetical protein